VQNAHWGALRGENTKAKTSTHHHYHEASRARRLEKNLEGHQAYSLLSRFFALHISDLIIT